MNISARREAVERARRLAEMNPVFLDTETTGTGSTAEVIEIAIVDSKGDVLIDSLVKPQGNIELDAARIHGITQEEVDTAPPWAEVWPKVEDILLSNHIGIYNADFDVRLMQQTLRRYWFAWQVPDENVFCIMKLYAQFYGQWNTRRGSYRWHSLDAAGKQCHIPLSNLHRACDDALLARAVFEHMVNWQG